MDGYSKEKVPQKDIRKVPSREKKNKLIGKRFFDPGDDKPAGRQRSLSQFKRGEFTVLCYQKIGSDGKSPSYWCERVRVGDDITVKRDIQEFGCEYVMKLVTKYDNE